MNEQKLQTGAPLMRELSQEEFQLVAGGDGDPVDSGGSTSGGTPEPPGKRSVRVDRAYRK